MQEAEEVIDLPSFDLDEYEPSPEAIQYRNALVQALEKMLDISELPTIQCVADPKCKRTYENRYVCPHAPLDYDADNIYSIMRQFTENVMNYSIDKINIITNNDTKCIIHPYIILFMTDVMQAQIGMPKYEKSSNWFQFKSFMRLPAVNEIPFLYRIHSIQEPSWQKIEELKKGLLHSELDRYLLPDLINIVAEYKPL